jgi:hypothetical protein
LAAGVKDRPSLEAERGRAREQLERYCGQDTEGMIWIVDALRTLSGPL